MSEAAVSTLLPIADGPELRLQARALGRRHRRGVAGVLVLHALAAGAGLAGPPLLGALVQSVVSGTTTSYVDRIVLLLALFVAVQTVVTWFARRASFVLAEEMFAELREDFMDQRAGPAALDRRARRARETSSPARRRTSTRSPARSASHYRRR